MAYNKDGFKQGLFSALNRYIIASLFPVSPGPGQREKRPCAATLIPLPPKILGQEKYLTIPTFIRQGKTLDL